MRVHRLFITIMDAGLLVACAPVPTQPRPMTHFSNNGATQEQLVKDFLDCRNESQQRVEGAYVNNYLGGANRIVVPSCAILTSCLDARGYTVDPNGSLTAPNDLGVNCR